MKITSTMSIIALFMLTTHQARAFEMGDGTQTICADGTSTLCSTLPTDMNHVAISQGYVPSTNSGGPNDSFTQTFVDYFGWQAFIALNWPVDANGAPSTSQTLVTDATSPRVWSTYKTKDDVFQTPTLSAVNATCATKKGKLRLFRTSKFDLTDFQEAVSHDPLIDQNGNFVLYDIRLNDTEANYLTANNLTTVQGQKNFNKTYDFPAGVGAKPGAIEIKSSWRIMTPQDDQQRYYTTEATIVVPAQFSASGQPMCIDATVGLVGMHIGQKFTNPAQFSNFWSWSTFEHVLNAPLADNAPISPVNRNAPTPDSMFSPPTCARTPIPTDQTNYSFYTNACDAKTCLVNAPPAQSSVYQWAATQPYAAKYMTKAASKSFGTQVARCFDIYPSAKAVTQSYQAQLGNSPWANYMLVGAQWAIAKPADFQSPLKPYTAPVYLTNTTMETYIQTGPALSSGKSTGSCIGCHNVAVDAAGNNSNLSFLPKTAKHNSGK